MVDSGKTHQVKVLTTSHTLSLSYTLHNIQIKVHKKTYNGTGEIVNTIIEGVYMTYVIVAVHQSSVEKKTPLGSLLL